MSLSPLRSTLRPFLYRAAAAVLGLILAASVGEVLLRTGRNHLSPKLRAFISNCYDAQDDVNGIYYMDPRLGLTLPRPDFSTTCSWNGYDWRHRGDHSGFRNPKTLDTTDIAILGDSIVYGHGVEEGDTIAARLRSQMGLAVTNFGVTGASPVHYLAFSRNYALRLHPKALVIVIFANDLLEIPLQRSADEIARFSRDAVGREMRILPPDALTAFAPRPALSRRILSDSVFLRTFLYGMHALSEETQTETPEPVPTRPDVVDLEQPFGPSVAYLRRVLGVLAADTKRTESRLIVLYVPATLGNFGLENAGLPRMLSESADSGGYFFIDTTPALTDGQGRGKPGTRLPHDGHLTGAGAAVVADLIATQLRGVALAAAPLGTNLSIASPWMRLSDFWDVESDAGGVYAWTKRQSAIELTGLPAGAALKLHLHVRHVGPYGDLRITTVDGRTEQLSVAANQSYAVSATLRADERGHLSLRLTARPFRPSEHGPSKDERELGIGLSGVDLELSGQE